MAVATDGCGVPVFGITVKAMALAFAKLVSPSSEIDENTKAA
jgi:L-asparaginase II